MKYPVSRLHDDNHDRNVEVECRPWTETQVPPPTTYLKGTEIVDRYRNLTEKCSVKNTHITTLTYYHSSVSGWSNRPIFSSLLICTTH